MLTSSSADLRARLRRQLHNCAYPGYVYGYPHKKAYRPLDRPVALADAWAGEDRRNLFCYVHLPFCGQRCSFCNLFTYVPADSPAPAYLDALAREMDAYAEALHPFRVARLYLGGGTPTFLTTNEIRQLVEQLRSSLGVDPAATHGCIEASPETLDAEKVSALRELGFRRVSLGVQSFVEEELRAVNRRFDFALHAKALRLLGDAGFPHVNVDLIYGLPGQTMSSWCHSLELAINSPATSLFLYPLYVRPMTGLAMRANPTPCLMAAMYDHAVERLASAGFRQLTMRQFRRDDGGDDGEYDCARDGMIGLGAGARSYTTGLHYSTPWKMLARNIRGGVEEYVQRRDTAVSYGFLLDDNECRRRYVIQTLLYDGAAYDERYADVFQALLDEGCARRDGDLVRLTPLGTRHADVVGQQFFSDRVNDLIATYEYDT